MPCKLLLGQARGISILGVCPFRPSEGPYLDMVKELDKTVKKSEQIKIFWPLMDHFDSEIPNFRNSGNFGISELR